MREGRCRLGASRGDMQVGVKGLVRGAGVLKDTVWKGLHARGKEVGKATYLGLHGRRQACAGPHGFGPYGFGGCHGHDAWSW